MIIQVNTDKNISGNKKIENYLNSLIKEALSRFTEYITRIEVYLSDQNGQKKGAKDKHCVLEARLKNRQRIGVISHGNTVEQAVSDALDKLMSSLE